MKILQGDCIEKMKELEDNSIDTVICDPPYGLEFMGKEWDKFGVSKARAKRLLGVDNEGTGDKFFDHREGASKRGRYSELSVKEKSSFQEFIYQASVEMLRVTKPGGTMLMFGGSRTYHRVACAIEDAGWVLKDCIMWLYGSGFPKAHDIGKSVEKIKVGGIKNLKQIGTKKGIKVETRTQGYSYNKEYVAGKCMGGKQISGEIPVYEINNKWNGWKSHGLKPAYEPILVAMKPNDGTYANNALKHGVSGLNIDGGRIGTEIRKTKGAGGTETTMVKGAWGSGKGKDLEFETTGRFPANILLDEEAAKLLGEPSRFFYVAKASKAERNAGCDNIELKEGDSLEGGIDKRTGKTNQPLRANNHPTVKPIKLMEYLCILTKTPTGGIVLDPFAGSGTTGLACQNTDRDFIGIELDPEYCKIAEARIGDIEIEQLGTVSETVKSEKPIEASKEIDNKGNS